MRHFFTQSISRLVMGSFVFVLLLPLGFIISSLTQHSWDNAQKELQEKHLLLAKSLEKPVSLYISSYQQSLQVFVDSTDFSTKNTDEIKTLLDAFVNSLENIAAISFLSIESGSSVIALNDLYKIRASSDLKSLAYHQTEQKYRKYDIVNSISSVIRSPVSKKPVVLIKHHIIGHDMNKTGTIFAELDLAPIRKICQNVRFGKNGHCAIVDQLGQVVAHPNGKFEEEIRDISATGIVDKMENIGSGLWTFHSPFLKVDVVTGFTTIDKLGWGIMIPQPKSELESPFKTVINTVFTWLAVGIIISLLVAYILTQQITKPLNSLVTKSKEIGTRSDTFNLGRIPRNSPGEISELWGALSGLVNRLHKSNKEVRKLNYSLSKDIEKATAKLRATNRHLYKMSSNDHLTKIANRRFFEDSVNKILAKSGKENIGIIVIDVDKFKFINDEYGHEAGDLALVHIAKIMQQSTRKNDIPARLGGDEFVIYINNCTDAVLLKIAENLRHKVESTPIIWEKKPILLSLSVGTVNCPVQKVKSLDQLLKFADEAMYESKEAGRNHVSSYSFGPSDETKREEAKKEEEINKIKAKAEIEILRLQRENKIKEQVPEDEVSELDTILDGLPHEPEDLTEEILEEKEEQKEVSNYWSEAR